MKNETLRAKLAGLQAAAELTGSELSGISKDVAKMHADGDTTEGDLYQAHVARDVLNSALRLRIDISNLLETL